MSEIRWNMQQLRNLRQAYEGQPPSNIFRSTQEPVEDGRQDMLILGAEQTPDLKKEFARMGVEAQQWLEDGASARLSSEEIADLKEQGYDLIDNRPMTMLESLPALGQRSSANASNQWKLPTTDANKMVKADVLQSQGLTGKGQVVAVLDSGFDYAPMNDKVAYFNVINGSREHSDGNGHGTHSASHVHRAAPDAKLIAIQVMNDDGTGRPSDIIAGLQLVSKLNRQGTHVDVVNMSLGGEPDGLPDRRDPINRQVDKLSQEGTTVVAAAGNSGPDGHTIGSPADAPSAIAVGAGLDPTHLSDFSSCGPTDDGVTRPHLVGPGEFMPGWAVPGSELQQIAEVTDKLRSMTGEQLKKLLRQRPELAQSLGLPPQVAGLPPEKLEKVVKTNLPAMGINENGEVLAPGTSFAAPVISGVVAQLEQARDLSPEANRELLMKTARPMPGYEPNQQGAGFIDAEQAGKALLG